MTANHPTVSLIIPCHNESDNLPALYERVHTVMENIGKSWELVCVNDGSKIVSNFELNNRFTYRTNKLRGYKYWLGLAAFMLISGLGGVANVGISSMLYTNKFTDIFSSLAGSIVGVVWNYAISSTLIWRLK